MRHINRYIGSFVLAAALVAPAMLMADPKPQSASVQLRFYDRDHRDYHEWNDNEDHHYRTYLVERHRTYVEFGRQHRREQKHYWKWRHNHRDND